MAGVAESTRAARQRAYEDAITLKPAILLDIDPTNAEASIQVDGPNGGPAPAQVVGPTRYYPGDRIMVLFTHPRGCLILGRYAGDYDDWHVVGGDSEPTFNTGWGPAAGTVALGSNGGASPMFTKRGDIVELRGWAERSSGSSQVIYSLPPGYRPENDLVLQAGANLGANTVLTVDTSTGQLAVPVGGTFCIFDGIQFIARPPTD